MRWNLPQERAIARIAKGLALRIRGAGILILVALQGGLPAGEPGSGLEERSRKWADTVIAVRRELGGATPSQELLARLDADFPIEMDWLAADSPGDDPRPWFGPRQTPDLDAALVRKAIEEASVAVPHLAGDMEGFRRSGVPPGDRRWLELYAQACRARRALRLRTLVERSPRIVFTKHHNLGGSHYAYTEGLSDAQAERQWNPGSSLCILEVSGDAVGVRTLLDDPGGVIRDPDVSYEGDRVLFSWKRSDRNDDYHLHEMDPSTGAVRQITHGLGFADYEGTYLPDGDIVFNSTRCVQTVDCWWTEVSNLYACDPNGRCLRRLGFDQVHTNFPQVLEDGRIVYTRWDYNDRGQIFPQGLFHMNPDGTAQTELYGNSSWFPTTILHARGIPGTTRLAAILTGHHSIQVGKLAVIDVAGGRQENQGVELVSPRRPTPAVKVDAYGQDGELFQYPYPIGEDELILAYAPAIRQHGPPRFAIYHMTMDGRRELLASDPRISCNQPVPLAPRRRPPARPITVDYRATTGTYYLQDIYRGEGLRGVPRGSIEKLRVVALEYRAAGIGFNYSKGPGGAALSSTPVSVGNGCWDVKVVLGEARVHEDGSACFIVPARTPLYFQAIDRNGHAAQTMRSWSTLQPGEFLSCAGCHESKNESPPPVSSPTLAMREGPQELEPSHGPRRGFSFIREVQPILDRHCVRCHDGNRGGPAMPSGPGPADPEAGRSVPADASGSDTRQAFSLLGRQTVEAISGRSWSDAYLALTSATPLPLSRGGDDPLAGRPGELVSWIGTQSAPPVLPPYHAGAARSRLLRILEEGHGGVRLSREETETIACWIDLLVPYCGDYLEANCWTEEQRSLYRRFQEKRRKMEELEKKGIAEFLEREGSRGARPSHGATVAAPETTR